MASNPKSSKYAQGADHSNGSGNTNPSAQDGDKDTLTNIKSYNKAAADMNFDGGLKTNYGK